MRTAPVRPAMKLTAAVALAVLAQAAAGCASDKVYDGSNSFYDQHPGYNDKPAYMSPSDEPDAHPGRPW